MTHRQQQIVRAMRDWGPLVVLALGVKVLWPADQLKLIETRTDKTESRVADVEMRVHDLGDLVEGYALSQCMVEKHPIVRQRLQCGRLETEAGIQRR